MCSVFCGFRGFDAREVDFSRDYLFPGQMAATLREELVFNVKACNVCPNVLVYGRRDGNRA